MPPKEDTMKDCPVCGAVLEMWEVGAHLDSHTEEELHDLSDEQMTRLHQLVEASRGR